MEYLVLSKNYLNIFTSCRCYVADFSLSNSGMSIISDGFSSEGRVSPKTTYKQQHHQ